MDEFIHRPKPYLLLLATCDEILSLMIEIQIKKFLGKCHLLQHCRGEVPMTDHL